MRFDPHLFGKPDLESEKTYQGKPDCKLDPESATLLITHQFITNLGEFPASGAVGGC
jgi:hypothetical protein